MSSTTSKRLKRVWQLSEDARVAGRSTIKVTDLEAALAGTYGAPYGHTLAGVAKEFGVNLGHEVGDRVLVKGISSPATIRSVTPPRADGWQLLGVNYDDDPPQTRGTHHAGSDRVTPYLDTEDNQ